jgi:hypothetical protein
MSDSCASTWPEQNAIQDWRTKHNLQEHVTHKCVIELADAVTKIRLEYQHRAEAAEAELKRIKNA